MLKLHLVYEHDINRVPHGSAYIRLLLPFSHPSIAGAFTVSSGADLPDKPVDVVILERLWRPDISREMAKQFVATVRKLHARFIYTLDDNLLDLNVDSPWKSWPTDEQRMIVRYFLREADGVIVSTKRLKERFSHLHQRIEVVPNALDERLFPIGRRVGAQCDDSEVVTVGYMGTRTHLADLMMVLQPLRKVLHAAQGKVRFEVVGVAGAEEIASLFSGLPVVFLDADRFAKYPSFIGWAADSLCWDIAIAPLEENRFTAGKSDIKFLDYSLLGVPTVCSNVEAYCHTVRNGQNGIVCDNRPESWEEGLTDLVKDRGLRERLASAAREEVLRTRILAVRAVDWKAAAEGFL